jgi:hypothetical protein
MKRTFTTIAIFLVLITTLVSSCTKEHTSPKIYDLTVLGIEEFLINDESVELHPESFELILGNRKDLLYNGRGSFMPYIKEHNYNYLYISNSDSQPEFEVRSKYDDTSVKIEEEYEEKATFYIVTVSRTGFEQKITYKFRVVELKQ